MGNKDKFSSYLIFFDYYYFLNGIENKESAIKKKQLTKTIKYIFESLIQSPLCHMNNDWFEACKARANY